MHPAVAYVQTELPRLADPEKAAGMSRYIHSRHFRRIHGEKDEMPFYGVQGPGRALVLRHLKKEFAPVNRDEYEDLATALWELPHREEKYLAQGVATGFPRFIVPESLPLYHRFIVEGAWWDFVDETATHMIRALVLDHPEEIWPAVDAWNDDNDMWLRRTSIICQVGAKERTDVARLFRFCSTRLAEKEFFIRKAIGWALRDYARTDPDAVAAYVAEHHDAMSGISFREATKHIGHLV